MAAGETHGMAKIPFDPPGSYHSIVNQPAMGCTRGYFGWAASRPKEPGAVPGIHP